MQFKYADEYKKIYIRKKALAIQRAVLHRIYRMYSTTPMESLQIVIDTPFSYR